LDVCNIDSKLRVDQSSTSTIDSAINNNNNNKCGSGTIYAIWEPALPNVCNR